MLPRPYVGSYSSEKGHQILQQPWIIALAKSIETFIIVSIFENKMDKFTERGKESYYKFITELIQKNSFGAHTTVL